MCFLLDSRTGLPTGPLLPTLYPRQGAGPGACDLAFLLKTSQRLCFFVIQTVAAQLYLFIKAHSLYKG